VFSCRCDGGIKYISVQSTSWQLYYVNDILKARQEVDEKLNKPENPKVDKNGKVDIEKLLKELEEELTVYNKLPKNTLSLLLGGYEGVSCETTVEKIEAVEYIIDHFEIKYDPKQKRQYIKDIEVVADFLNNIRFKPIESVIDGKNNDFNQLEIKDLGHIEGVDTGGCNLVKDLPKVKKLIAFNMYLKKEEKKIRNIILIFSIGLITFNIVKYVGVKNIFINKAMSKKEIIIVGVNTVILLILLFSFHKYKHYYNTPAEELIEELIKINNKQKKKTNDNVKLAMAAVLVSGEKSNC
jgi:hypothetical protein